MCAVAIPAIGQIGVLADFQPAVFQVRLGLFLVAFAAVDRLDLFAVRSGGFNVHRDVRVAVRAVERLVNRELQHVVRNAGRLGRCRIPVAFGAPLGF